MENTEISHLDNDLHKKGKRVVHEPEYSPAISKMIQSEIAKHLASCMQKGRKQEEHSTDGVINAANMTDIDLGSSPIDFTGQYAFGATTHMCCQIRLLKDLKKLRYPL